jgi:uncharacterized spore protein YtfJ
MMEKEIQKLLDTLNDLRKKAHVNTCFGEPVSTEGRTIIPIASVSCGFGMGIGGKKDAKTGSEDTDTDQGERESESGEGGGGGGGGMKVHPLGVIEVTSKGTRVKPVVDQQKVTLASILLTGWITFWVASTLITIFGEREES